MSQEGPLPPLPKITPETELIGVEEGHGLSIIEASHVGELLVADVLGENSASKDVRPEVDGGDVFKVDKVTGNFVSHDGTQVYDKDTKSWIETTES